MQVTASVWGDALAHLRDLAIAYALALPVGWSWERKARSAGLRTYPLVAIASCGFALLAARVAGTSAEAQARVLQGLITGVGFLAAGAVIKDGGYVRGTANAASIWATGAAGAATGFGFYDIALVLSAVNFVTLWLLAPLKHEVDRQGRGEPAEGVEGGESAEPSARARPPA